MDRDGRSKLQSTNGRKSSAGSSDSHTCRYQPNKNQALNLLLPAKETSTQYARMAVLARWPKKRNSSDMLGVTRIANLRLSPLEVKVARSGQPNEALVDEADFSR